jgi:UDP-2,4-diacetamido-2,4,6-trideoxy-beta-L-altropyranose hydrolase
MKKIVFRVNAGQGSGVGHLARCCSLATQLQTLGHECIFLLARFDVSVLPFLDGFDYRYLYNDYNDEELIHLATDKGWALDAKLTINFLKGQSVDWLIVDDYSLGKEWEAEVIGLKIKLLVIDDLCREHICDALLDMRWRGEQTSEAYDNLIPTIADRLIGPQYALLANQYQQKKVIASSHTNFTVLVGVGGGSDSLISIEIISALLQLTQSSNYIIKPILGPFTENKQQLLNKYSDHPNIKPIVDCYDLYPHLIECDLYVGAAGGVLYQLLALNKPAITFSLAPNQQTSLVDLEGIGHYFHCDSGFDVDQLAALVATISAHYSRVKKMDSKAINIDGLGVSRVVEYMLGGKPSALRAFIKPEQDGDIAYEKLNEDYSIRAVVDADINHYLDSRNLPANAQNMIESKLIERLGHYAWWFNTERDSFLLEKNKQTNIYIWHQVQQYKNRQFLIGGWFVCQENTSFQDALLALNWQLEHCDKHWPNLPWIAVIHRKNRYVKLMNDYLGFKEVPAEHEYFDASGSIFARASIDDFYYVMRETVSDPLSPLTFSKD